MRRRLIFVCFFALTLLLIRAEVIYVAQIGRHGSKLSKTRYFAPKSDEPGVFREQLSMNGMREQYILGSYLHERYIIEEKLLSETYNPAELKIVASDTPRTISSAYALATGLYPPATGPVLSNELLYEEEISLTNRSSENNESSDNNSTTVKQQADWAIPGGFNAIPVKILSAEDDFLDGYSQKYCPAELEIQYAAAHSNKTMEFTNEMRPTLNQLAAMLNISEDKVDLQLGLFAYGEMVVMEAEGLPLPVDKNDSFYKNLSRISGYYTLCIHTATPQIVRVFNTHLIQSVLEELEGRINGESNVKMSLYATHNINQVTLLVGLGLLSLECLDGTLSQNTDINTCAELPKFSAFMTIELHNITGKYYIKFLYNNKVRRLCENMTSDGLCSYETIRTKLINGMVSESEFSRVCKRLSTSRVISKLTLTMIHAAFVAGAITFLTLSVLICQKKKRSPLSEHDSLQLIELNPNGQP